MEPAEPLVETLPGGTRLFCDKTHPVTTDSLLLARFCGAKPKWSVCDLGAGGGILVLSLLDAGTKGPAVAVECQPEAVALLNRAKEENALEGLTVHHGDVRGFALPRPVDVVVSNPPYFTAGAQSPVQARAAARHQQAATLADFCHTAARIIKDGGRFCLCYPAEKLAEAFGCLRAAGLEPKRLQLVRKTSADAPWLLLADARKAAGVGLQILPDILLPPGQPVHY